MDAAPYVDFTRDEWSTLRAATELTLSFADLEALRSNEPIALDEVEAIYLPLSRLLSLRVEASRELFAATETFLGHLPPRVPYVIGIAGSVAVGKSTISRLLQALLSAWPHHPRVDLVTTDGFLFPNAVLEARGLMSRKGFPESYDVRRLLRFLGDLKAGHPEVHAPRYSHLTYDILPGDEIIVRQPDIVILEGLNVLQAPTTRAGIGEQLVVSDFFDFSIYVDAEEQHLQAWYVDRFLSLRETAFQDQRSFFHHFTAYSEEDCRVIAKSIWEEINGVNLRENILPTRGRANLVLEKNADHGISRVRLRKL
ncbi:MAG: coaA [Actinomycetia bacterium]|nr:coaA [Actinomycetes bacterium]